MLPSSGLERLRRSLQARRTQPQPAHASVAHGQAAVAWIAGAAVSLRARAFVRRGRVVWRLALSGVQVWARSRACGRSCHATAE